MDLVNSCLNIINIQTEFPDKCRTMKESAEKSAETKPKMPSFTLHFTVFYSTLEIYSKIKHEVQEQNL